MSATPERVGGNFTGAACPLEAEFNSQDLCGFRFDRAPMKMSGVRAVCLTAFAAQ